MTDGRTENPTLPPGYTIVGPPGHRSLRFIGGATHPNDASAIAAAQAHDDAHDLLSTAVRYGAYSEGE